MAEHRKKSEAYAHDFVDAFIDIDSIAVVISIEYN